MHICMTQYDIWLKLGWAFTSFCEPTNWNQPVKKNSKSWHQQILSPVPTDHSTFNMDSDSNCLVSTHQLPTILPALSISHHRLSTTTPRLVLYFTPWLAAEQACKLSWEKLYGQRRPPSWGWNWGLSSTSQPRSQSAVFPKSIIMLWPRVTKSDSVQM